MYLDKLSTHLDTPTLPCVIACLDTPNPPLCDNLSRYTQPSPVLILV